MRCVPQSLGLSKGFERTAEASYNGLVATNRTRPNRWRNFPDASPAEKAEIKALYSSGEAVIAIAQRCRVYAGSIYRAAESGRWHRPTKDAPVASRIIAALAEHPTMSDPQVAKRARCHPSYVATIRYRLKGRAAE